MKTRFRTLDAMRGFAALVVVFYHSPVLISLKCSNGLNCKVPFGYLAVDLFFALSGFVLAHSYDRRLEAGLSTAAFMRARLVRLLPIYLVGLLIGAAPHIADALHGQGGGKRLAVEMAFNAGFLPHPTSDVLGVPFPIDPPAWSLFFEIWVANLLFSAGHRIIRGRALLGLITVSFIGLIVTQSHFSTMNVGSFWSDFAGGIPRVLFSFFVGVLVYRIRDRYRTPTMPAWLILVLVVATFWPPFDGLAGHIFELVAVACIYPIALFLGARAIERRPALGQALGDWSYAVYVIHVPMLHLAIHEIAIHGWTPAPAILGAYLAFVLVTAAGLAKIDLLLIELRKRTLTR